MNPFSKLFSWITKDNPSQNDIADQESSSTTATGNKTVAANSFTYDEVVNRCTNLLTDCSAEVDYDVGSKYTFTPIAAVKPQVLKELLNVRPNPYMNVSEFRRLVLLDYWFSGRAFMYWDGASLYHLPEALMEVNAATSGGYIESFVFNNTTRYLPSEIIFLRDNSYKAWGASQISGTPRYQAASNAILRKDKIGTFKENYIDNGTVLGLILETEQVLNRNFKNRILEDIKLNYNTRSGKFANTAFILDGGIKAKSTNQTPISELGLTEDISSYNDSICTAFGVPPILLQGGNNANIRPNIELMFYLTIIPNLKKLASALEVFFGFDIKLDTSDVAALYPDQAKEASRVTSLVNNGIITGNEGRTEMRYPPINEEQMETIRIPQNVAGSATGVSGETGGAPTK